MARNSTKRGMTLVELTVVLAVIAIVSTLVVTFVLMISGESRAASARLNALEEIELVESLTETWLEDHPDAEKVAETDDPKIVVKSDPDYLSLEGDTLGYKNGERESSIKLEQVTKLEVSINEGSQDKLFVCKLTYTVAGAEEHYVFCVDPHKGETTS